MNDSNEAHVHPLDDAIAHELTQECVCGPDVEPVKRDDGSMGFLVTHHSLTQSEDYGLEVDGEFVDVLAEKQRQLDAWRHVAAMYFGGRQYT